MGVSIHYRGQLRSLDQIAPLTAEVEDVCKSQEWEYRLVDMDIPIGDVEAQVIHFLGGPNATSIRMQGLWFKVHEESEAFYLCFDDQGRMLSLINLLVGDSYPTLDDIFWIHTKTQYAGPEAHAVLIRFIQYLAKKYFADLEVLDETNYWATGDVAQLHKVFYRTQAAIDMFSDALENIEIAGNPSIEQLADQIESLFRRIINSKEDSDEE